MTRFCLIFPIVLLFLSPVFGQNNIKKTAGVTYTQGVPTWTPAVASSSEISIDTSTGKIYQWHRTTAAWLQLGQGIDVISGSIAPAYTPARNQSIFAINAADSLYTYRSGAWRHLNPAGADDWGTQVVETDATLTGDGTSGDPLAWAGASVAGPITGSGTSGFPLNILSASLDSTYYKNYGLSVLDIGQNGASSGNVIKWNGTQWAPAVDIDTDTGGDVGIINAADYGATGDGVTDDTDSLQAAINAAAGQRLWIPEGTYFLTDSLVVQSNTEIVMSPNTILDCTSFDTATAALPYNNFLFSIIGTYSDSLVITQDITLADTDIKVASAASSYAKGDIVEVKSTEPLHTSMTNRFKGYVTFVDSIIGDTIIRLSNKSFFNIDAVGGSYTASIRKWNTKERIKISGGTIRGPGVNHGMTGVMAKYTRDITIENVTIEDCEMSGVGLEECFMPIVRGCRVLRATSPTYLGLGLGYGVWLGTATYAGLVENCYFEECRHSVAAGGETPSMYGSIYKNNSINAGVGSEDFDCHEATYGYRFVGNTTQGGPDSRSGFNIRGVDVLLEGNQVNNGYIRLIDNFSTDSAMGRMTLIGNVVRNSWNGNGIEVLQEGMYDISIIGGSIENCSSFGIKVVHASRNIKISGVSFIDIPGPAISLDDCNGASVSNSTFQNCTVGVEIKSTSKNIVVSNCVGVCTNSFLTATSANYIAVDNCIASGITGSHAVYFNQSNKCKVSDCIFDMNSATNDLVRAWGSSTTANNISVTGTVGTGSYKYGLYAFSNSDTIVATNNNFVKAATAQVYAPNATISVVWGNVGQVSDHGDIDVSAGLGPTLTVDTSAITNIKIAANAIDSTKICSGCVSVLDLGQHGASSGQVLGWNGTQWAPSSGLALPSGVNLQTLAYNSSNVLEANSLLTVDVPNKTVYVSANSVSTNLTIRNDSSLVSRYPGVVLSNFQSGTSGNPVCYFRNANGYAAAPTIISANTIAGGLLFQAYGSASYRDIAAIEAKTGSSFTDSDREGLLIFKTADGASSPSERMRITNTGLVGIGTTTIPRTLTVNGEVRISDLTTDNPTFLTGADADGDISKAVLGAGLSFSNDTLNSTALVSSVAATAPAAGFTISGSPITTTGTLTFSLANDLSAVEGLSGTGIAARTATDTWTTRTITAGTGISVSNGSGVSGNPTISADTTVTNNLLPHGTNTWTLRHNGTAWTANNVLTNDGTTVGVNSAPNASYQLHVKQPSSTAGLYVARNSSTAGVHLFHDGAANVASVGGFNLKLSTENSALINLVPGGGGGQISQIEIAPLNNITAVFGNTSCVNVNATYAPTSAGGDYSAFRIGGSINQTESADQRPRGLGIFPTLTNVISSGYFGIEYRPSNAGGETETFLFQPIGAAVSNRLAGDLYIGTDTTMSAAKVQILGDGATSGTYSLIVTNSGGATSTAALVVRDDSRVGIGTNAPAEKLSVAGNVELTTAGNKLKIATGSNASMGTATLVGGTVTVSTTAVATGSTIFLTCNTPGGTQGFLSAPAASIVNATSFVINSSSGTDTSTVNWWIVN